MARTKLFISYAHEDNPWRVKVVSNLGVLSRKSLIDIWDDQKLDAGENWRAKINDAMGRARIALLLISTPFLNSDFIQKKEIPKLFRRHESDGMTIYPLLIKYCLWEEVRWLKRMQIRPDGAKPVSDHGKIDKVLTEVAREIARIVRKRVAKRSGKLVAKKSAKRTSKKSRTRKLKSVRPGSGKKTSARTAKRAVRRVKKPRARAAAKGRKVGRKDSRRISRRAKPK